MFFRTTLLRHGSKRARFSTRKVYDQLSYKWGCFKQPVGDTRILCPCTKMPLNKNACVEVCRSRAWLFVTCSKSIQFTHFSIYSLTVRLHKPFTIKGSHRSGLIVSRVSEKTSSFTFFDRVVFVLRSKHSCAISFGIS